MKLWPFKRKSKIIKPKKETINLLDMILKAPPCPEKHLISRSCICLDCEKMPICPVEKACQREGCEEIVLTCSVKTRLTYGKDAISDFGANVSKILTLKILREFTYEQQQKAMKELLAALKAKEETNGTKETGNEGTDNGEGPPVNL